MMDQTSVKESDHLQKLTLNRIPIPDKNIGVQDLLKQQDVMGKGWLKRKKPSKIAEAFSALLSSIAWDQKYVVLSKGCMYFYNNLNERKPEKAFSLFGYTRVMRAGELRSGREGLWPFKLAYVLDEKDRVHYFSAACEDEMMEWLKKIKTELYRANGVEYEDDCVGDEDINDLETPISTVDRFKKIENLKTIKEKIEEDDSDMDSEYDYVDDLEIHKPQPTSKSGASVAKPSVVLLRKTPPKPVKSNNQDKRLEGETRNVKYPLAATAGYYPPILNVEITSPIPTKPLPPIPNPYGKKSVPPVPSSKPTINQKSASDQKLLPSKTPPYSVQPKPPVKSKQMEVVQPFKSEASKAGQNSSEASPSSNFPSELVGDLRQTALSAHLAEKFGKKKTPSTPPVHPPLAESPSFTKPLPSLPASRVNSNAPTAVVSPVRKPSANRLLRDLEESALWTKDGGEGQRLLVNLGKEGGYMLRSCSDGSGSVTLLVIAECQLRKYKIFRNEQSMVSLQTDFQPSFDSVHNLLNHYKRNYLPKRQQVLSQSYLELQTT